MMNFIKQIEELRDGLADEKQKILDSSTDSIILLAGYDFNEYFGIEGRYYINNSSLAYDYYLGGTEISDAYEAESLTLYVHIQPSLLTPLKARTYHW